MNIEAIKELLKVEHTTSTNDLNALNELNAQALQGSKITAHLHILQRGIQENLGEWQAIHNELADQIKLHGPLGKQHTHLASWLYACLMHAKSLEALSETLTDNAREIGNQELEYAEEWVASAENKLVSTCLEWPAVGERVLRLRLMKQG